MPPFIILFYLILFYLILIFQIIVIIVIIIKIAWNITMSAIVFTLFIQFRIFSS